MTEQNYVLVVKDETGALVLSKDVATLYNNIVQQQSQANDMMSTFRDELLKAMIDNGIQSAKIENLTCSLVIPSNIVEFDVEKFMLNEPTDVVQCFTTVETYDEFDLEKFKAENPEMYAKYTKVIDKPVVDVKKLAKALPPVYEKYATEIKSDKPIRLMIKEAKV